MLLIILLLCLLTSLFVAIRRRDSMSFYLLGACLSNSLMLAGVAIYIAKTGGLDAMERVFLFVVPALQRWLQYRPISMDKLGYAVALGRTLFPVFLLQIAISTTRVGWIMRRQKLVQGLSLLPAAFFLIYYFPGVFRAVVRGRFWLLTAMLPVSLGWILIYLALALGLMIQEYRAQTIHFFKQNFRLILLSLMSITALYLLYATRDPAQIYNMFVGEYIRLGITSYISSFFSGLEWFVLGSCAVFFVILGSYNMVRYVQLDYDQDMEELRLQRKFDAAGMGVSVFVHGIKNQLLSSRVLHKKLARTLGEEEPDLEQARRWAAQLNELNEGMLGRMDELYRTVKNSALSLSPVPVEEVVASAVKRFGGKYPEGEVAVEHASRRLVLADAAALSEAVYNLLTNGYEAALQAGREPRVRISVSEERLWTVIQVEDNGGGIAPDNQNRIFEPFFTSKNTNFNWGMGLYYVHKIVKSHWGHLRLESQPGEGSTFFVMLPLFDAAGKG